MQSFFPTNLGDLSYRLSFHFLIAMKVCHLHELLNQLLLIGLIDCLENLKFNEIQNVLNHFLN